MPRPKSAAADDDVAIAAFPGWPPSPCPVWLLWNVQDRASNQCIIDLLPLPLMAVTVLGHRFMPSADGNWHHLFVWDGGLCYFAALAALESLVCGKVHLDFLAFLCHIDDDVLISIHLVH